MTGHGRLNAERTRLRTQELQIQAERRRMAALVAGRPRLSLIRSLASRLRTRGPTVTAADRAVLDLRIRYAGPGDDAAVARLASLDSAQPPEPPVLSAEVDSQLVVAVSLWDGRVVADPFRPTQALVELLTVRAAQIQSAAGALHDLREPAPGWKRRSQPGSERA